MIKYLFRHNKDYSRFNIIKEFTYNIKIKHEIFILMPFSKNQFIKNIFKRNRIINDFFISNYDTYVFDRKKITNKNPRAWWKYFQDWINFRFSKYLLSDTNEHFMYWEKLFGKFKGKHFVLPVLADRTIYYPSNEYKTGDKIKILFYGSFIPLHGIDVILKAFSLLERENIEFEAKIIGNGQKFNEMKKLFNELKLQNVLMNGELISEKELSHEIRNHDIILGIFGKSTKAQSVVPNKVYQSLACRKAVITMKSKAIDEFFSDSEIITCSNTPIDLSNNLKNLIKDVKKIEYYSNNGYRKFEDLYKDIKSKFQEFIKNIDENLDLK